MQSEDALSRAERINGLLDKWKRQVASSGSSVAVDIIEHFAVNHFLTIKRVTEKLGVAYSTAQRGIKKLEAKRIIKQVGGVKRDKVYCATGNTGYLREIGEDKCGFRFIVFMF